MTTMAASAQGEDMGESTTIHPDGWWQDDDPASAYRKYQRMHSSVTNRSKAAITENLLSNYDWTGKRVLEYGCGGGHFTIWMAKQGADVWAVERNPKAVALVNYAAEKEGVAERVHVIEGNAEVEGVPGDYDFIFAKDLIEHLDDDGPFLERISEQLRPGGHVFLATQNDRCLNYWIEGNFEKYVRGDKEWMGWDRTHYRFYNPRSLKEKLNRVGIDPERWGSSYLVPWRFLTKRLTGKPRPWEAWLSLDRALGTKAPFSKLGWSIMVIGRKAG
jgi:2-polyprenyl-6-hydroxyphenyl methylase/3-demethylubiquinone-9 3-methyltransferase